MSSRSKLLVEKALKNSMIHEESGDTSNCRAKRKKKIINYFNFSDTDSDYINNYSSDEYYFPDSLKEKDIGSQDDELNTSLVLNSPVSSITYQQDSNTTVHKLQSKDYQLEIDTQYQTSIDTENPFIYKITNLLTTSEQKEIKLSNDDPNQIIIDPNVNIIPGTPQENEDYIITPFIEPVVRRLDFDNPHSINTDLNVDIIPGTPHENEEYIITPLIDPNVVVRRLDFEIPHLINTDNNQDDLQIEYEMNKQKNSRKRKKNKENWKKNKAALQRSEGKEYISQKGKIMPAKSVNKNQLCQLQCRLQCSTNVDIESRNNLFNAYYKMEVNVKNAYIFKSIKKLETARKTVNSTPKKVRSHTFQYFVKTEEKDVKVCKTAFCEIYQIGRKKIELIQNQLKCDVSPPLDRKGKHEHRPNRISDLTIKHIMNHIESFPAESSHYSRNNNPNRKYLSPLLNIRKMYLLYTEKCKEDNMSSSYFVKEESYRNIFCTRFNLNFGNPKSDTCSRCDSGQMSDTNHIQRYKNAFEAQRKDKEKVLLDSTICYLTMDLQQTMPLPKLSTSKAFYLRQLWFYNFGVHTLSAENGHQPFMFTWTENIGGKGSNEVGSCLLYFVQIMKTIALKNIKHLIIWSDSCAGQNKNFNIICLYQYMIMKGYFHTIDHKFPEVGHSYLDSDRDFGRIEKRLRKHQNIYTPEQYRNIIKEASKKNTVISDMEHHFKSIDNIAIKLRLTNKKKNCEGEKISFRDGIKWLRVTSVGMYQYKEDLNEETPFSTVNIFKDKINTPKECTLTEHIKSTTISNEKIENLKSQLQFVPEEYKWFYEQLL